jgi:large subunit ribosomal protein L20
MARVKRGVTARRRHKKILKQAKGYYNARRKVFRAAKQAVTKALQYAYIGRKQKKRNFRSLWIARINAATRSHGMSYSRFINGMLKAGITLDRKVLADIAVHDAKGFAALVDAASKALGSVPAGKPDDLKIIEGIGPKIAEIFAAAGISTFAKLAATDVAKLREILDGAGSKFAAHDPTTWPQQAKLAAEGKMDALKVLQDELQGGRAA